MGAHLLLPPPSYPLVPLPSLFLTDPHLVSAHPGHHDIQQDDIGQIRLVLQKLQSLLTVHGLDDLKGGSVAWDGQSNAAASVGPRVICPTILRNP